MNRDKEQVSETFFNVIKKMFNRNKPMTVKPRPAPTEPPIFPRPPRKKKKSPEQLMLPLNRKRAPRQMALPIKMPLQPGENQIDVLMGQMAKHINNAMVANGRDEKRRRELVKLYRKIKKSGKNIDDIELDEVTTMIHEIINEELAEVNHTIDSQGKSIIAQGAPGSVIRFTTENPEVITAMRDWVKDCQWRDLNEDDIDNLSDEEILKGVQINYEGGIKAFIHDAQSRAQVPVGYKEGVGYVSDKDMKKDPKHIAGERWRVKFQSADDLKKHGNTEMSPISEVNEKPEYYQQLQYALNAARKKQDAEAMIYYIELMGRPGVVASVGFDRFKGSHLYDKWKQQNQDKIDLQKKRFSMPWLQEGISKSDLRNVIKELISEMWYGSKNDVEGDETHDEPLNEIFENYDKLIDFVKTLPDSEAAKINKISKEKGIGAFDAVVEYIKQMGQKETNDSSLELNESDNYWNPQPLPQDSHKVGEIIHSLKEGTGAFFCYDKVTGHSSDWIWIECVSDGETISYYMQSKGSPAKTDLEDDSMIDEVAQEIAAGGYYFFAIQSIQDYKKPSRHSHHPEDDQELGHYELYGADQPEPQV